MSLVQQRFFNLVPSAPLLQLPWLHLMTASSVHKRKTFSLSVSSLQPLSAIHVVWWHELKAPSCESALVWEKVLFKCTAFGKPKLNLRFKSVQKRHFLHYFKHVSSWKIHVVRRCKKKNQHKKSGVYFRLKETSCEAAVSFCWRRDGLGFVCCVESHTVAIKGAKTLFCASNEGTGPGQRGGFQSAWHQLHTAQVVVWCRGQFGIQHLKRA